MIDAHTHCLPGIDDGARDVEQSILMLTESFKQGTRKVIATPHCVVHTEADIEKFLRRRMEAENRLKEQNISDIPTLIPGAEVYLDNDISTYETISDLCIGSTKYMLIELCEGMPPEKAMDILYSLILKGVSPIIAHIDRYTKWREYVAAFRGLDIVYQINTSRFFTIKDRAFVKEFLGLGYDIIIGTDMHNTTSRPCTIEKAYKKAKSKFGDAVADSMFNNQKIELF